MKYFAQCAEKPHTDSKQDVIDSLVEIYTNEPDADEKSHTQEAAKSKLSSRYISGVILLDLLRYSYARHGFSKEFLQVSTLLSPAYTTNY